MDHWLPLAWSLCVGVCNVICKIITLAITVILVLDLLTWLWYIFSEMTYGQWQPADSQRYVTVVIKAVNPLLPLALSSQREGQLIDTILRAGSHMNMSFSVGLLPFYDAIGITFFLTFWGDKLNGTELSQV